MGQADYLFRISMDATGAMASAKTFAQQLKKDLGDIKIKPISVDVSAKQNAALVRMAGQTGNDMGALMGQNMQKSIQGFQSTAAQAQYSMGGPLMGALNTAIERPTTASIRAIDTLQGKLKTFDQEAGRLGFSAGGWMDASKFDRTMGALQVAQRQVWGIRGMGAQMGMYGGQMMAGGAAALGGAGMAAKEYGEFSAPLGRAARNLELNDKLTKELDASLRQLAGTASVFDPTQQAEGLYLWAAATGEVVDSSDELDTLLARVGEVQKLASLGMVSYGTSVAAVTDIQSQFQLSVTDTDRVVATLVKVAATSKAEVGDLADAFRYAGTYAHQTNTTFSETAAIFQLLSGFGQRGSMAGRGMARLMEGLIAPSKQAKEALDGVFKAAFGRTDVLTNAEGKFIGMANTVRTLAEATEDLSEAERANFVATITTQNAARVLLPLLSAEIEARKHGISAIEENIKILDNQADAHTNTYVKMMQDVYGYTVSTKSATQTMEDQWSQFLDSTDGRLKKSQASMQGAIVSIGASVMEFALPAMEKLAAIMQDIAAFSETHPGVVSALLGGAALTVTLGLLVKALGVGLTLYADKQAIMMALTYKTSVDQFGAEVAAFVGGVHEMSATSAYMMGGPAAGAGRAATKAVAAGPYMMGGPPPGTGVVGGGVGAAGIGLGAGLGVAAGILAATVGAAALATKLTTGRGFLDLMSTDAEALAAGMEAAAAAAGLVAEATEPGEQQKALEKKVAELKAEQEQWKEWIEISKTAAGVDWGPSTDEAREQRRRLLTEVPKDYRPFLGLTSDVRLLNQGLDENNSELEEYEKLLEELRVIEGQATSERADAVLMLTLERIEREKLAALVEKGIPKEVLQPARMDWSAEMTTLVGAVTPTGEWAKAAEAIRLDKLYELADVLGLDADAMTLFIRRMADMEASVSGLTGTTIQNAITMLREFGQAIPTEQELAGQLGGAAKGTWSSLQSLQGAGWDSGQIIALYQEYLSLMGVAYAEAEDMRRWEGELHVQGKQAEFDEIVSIHLDANAEMDKQAKASIDNQASMYKKAADGLRGFVEGALKPTQVTAEDVAATEAGTYVDKWDEEARRMRAAMAGEQEWEHMIPEGVRAQGLDAAQKWGQNWINEFYAGMHPGAIRWDPLLDSIEQSLAMAAGKRNLVDLAIEKLAERGVTATSEQVLAAMGMTGIIPAGFVAPGVAGALAASTPEAVIGQATALVDSLIGPMNQELANMDMGESATNLLMSLDRSLKAKGATIAWSQRVQDSVAADLKANKGQIEEAGMLIGDHLWAGMYRSFEDVNLVYIIAHKVLEIIGQGAV